MEAKWQAYWQSHEIFATDIDPSKPPVSQLVQGPGLVALD